MKKLIIIIFALLLIGCSSFEYQEPNEVENLPFLSPKTIAPTHTPRPSITPSPTFTLTPTATITPTPTLVPLTDFMEGVGYYGWARGDYLLPDTAWVMENQIVPTGANWIEIRVKGFPRHGIPSSNTSLSSPVRWS